MSEDPTGAEDDELVRRFLTTLRVEDFEVLVRRHQRQVFRVALSVLGRGRETQAEEVAQEVFLQVYRKLSSFQGRSRFSTWLYRVTYRRAIDEARSQTARRESSMPDQMPAPVTATPDSFRDRALSRCLAQLPDAHRTAIHLHYWMGHTVTEIAETLGTQPGTVKSWLFRARELLGRCLEAHRESA